MRLLNTLIALFLGGITAGALAINYGWSMFIAVPIGMVAGGLAYKPQEILSALRRAMQEVVGFDYARVIPSPRFFSEAWDFILDTSALLVGGTVGIGLGHIYAISIAQQFGVTSRVGVEIVGMAVLFASMFGMLFDLTSKDTDKNVIPTLNETLNKGAKLNHSFLKLFGLSLAITGAFGMPAFIALAITRFIAPAVVSIVKNAPAVFFRFVELVSTHDRQVVMASIAIGSLIGIGVGSVLICGLASMVVGLLATRTAKAVVRQRRMNTA